jgi:hypothetical protein
MPAFFVQLALILALLLQPSLFAPPEYKEVVTTVFWVGETADASNDYIANDASYWDSKWQQHFGGVDDPTKRCGYRPCAFIPRENPFYFALPYGEPIADLDSRHSTLKNRWIEVTHQGRTCYGQWQDVGPSLTDDYSYVFGTTTPRNTFGVRAGLDVSPALRDCLGMGDVATTSWRFVSQQEVPRGPWRNTITTSGIFWE